MVKAKQNKVGYRPSVEEISKTLMTDHIGAKPTELSVKEIDPVVPTPMVINLEEMSAYENNPRKGENPMFDDLYDRILSQKGLTDVLNITRRPGDEKYILSAGGNTRLSALRKAYEDTGESSFSKLYAQFIPFESESKILISHLAENGQRAGVTFIENALGVLEVGNLMQKETGKTYSQREFAESIKEEGYTVHRSLIGLYEYAAQKLLKVIPKALFEGLGRPRIQDIKNLEARLWGYVEFKGMSQDRFNLIFQQVFSEHDSDQGFNVEKVKGYLYVALCDALNSEMYTFEIECDAFHLEGPDSPVFKQPVVPDNQFIEGESESSITSSVNQPLVGLSRLTDDQSAELSVKKKPKEVMHPIAQQRRTCMRIAVRLAQHFKVDRCVRTNYNIGYGFIVDFPDKPFNDPIIASIWWLLYSVCGVADDPLNRVQIMDDSMILKQLFLANPSDLEKQFIARVGDNDISAFTMGILNNLDIDERHIRDIMDLSFACRKLQITANQYGMTQELWTYK